MAPVFSTSAVHDSGYGICVGQDDKHLKISVYKNNTIPLNSIGFGLGSKLALVQNKTPFDIAYAIEENEWNGQVSLQLKLKDIKP
jgi:single-stranded-DNA-specific exonuclease